MSESAPPIPNPNVQGTNSSVAVTAAASNAGSNADQTGNRGLPYYEKLRRELRDTLHRKRLMDKSMTQLEDQIFRFEQSYLEETTAGNIIKGFDNYIKGSSNTGVGATSLSFSSGVGGGGGGGTRRKAQVTDADRVFSRSSAGFMRDSTPSSSQTTPSHAPTPTSTYNGSTGKPNGEAGSAPGSVKGGSSSKNKKKSNNSSSGNKEIKNDEDEEGGDKPPTKRLKISYGRD
ncbi:NuA4-domain-containing protein [Aspergillus steynii IBT 23096]|uniref:Chromatin modification-related protein EAF6 n=1 Tax=Aspergillus steynii IBT 23096 TaxID=1392250 RepID=A0A2I2GIH9_9EURO|nr:NuA4-domain-containing protein [Aspergillus steynii IBT 23096]PLB52669.1 NuA4-domain-containing protein [Aspergillus steynii IBT 23096]